MALKHVAIDTNIAIEILNGNEATLQMLSEFDVIALPVTVCGELMYGAKNSSRAERNLAHYRAFIGSCEILQAKLPTAWEYANIKLSLKLVGRLIPENDIWIAAICQSYDIPFVSRDGHFSYIPSLQLLAYEKLFSVHHRVAFISMSTQRNESGNTCNSNFGQRKPR